MKRDMDLVRKILFAAIDDQAIDSTNPDLDGYSEEQISYHIHIMAEADLVDAKTFKPLDGSPAQSILLSVTWYGQDFADAAKDNTLWNKAKKIVLKEGGSFTFHYLKDWLQKNIEQLPLLS